MPVGNSRWELHHGKKLHGNTWLVFVNHLVFVVMVVCLTWKIRKLVICCWSHGVGLVVERMFMILWIKFVVMVAAVMMPLKAISPPEPQSIPGSCAILLPKFWWNQGLRYTKSCHPWNMFRVFPIHMIMMTMRTWIFLAIRWHLKSMSHHLKKVANRLRILLLLGDRTKSCIDWKPFMRTLDIHPTQSCAGYSGKPRRKMISFRQPRSSNAHFADNADMPHLTGLLQWLKLMRNGRWFRLILFGGIPSQGWSG